MPDKIAEVQKCRYSTRHISGHVAFDCWEPYLFLLIRGWGVFNETRPHTFMSAFESLPVHWLNPRPFLNRRRPGYNGTTAILQGTIRFGYRAANKKISPPINIRHNSCRSRF